MLCAKLAVGNLIFWFPCVAVLTVIEDGCVGPSPNCVSFLTNQQNAKHVHFYQRNMGLVIPKNTQNLKQTTVSKMISALMTIAEFRAVFGPLFPTSEVF